MNEGQNNGTVYRAYIRMRGREVRKVYDFKYLDSTVQSNGECGRVAKKRVHKHTKHDGMVGEEC